MPAHDATTRRARLRANDRAGGALAEHPVPWIELHARRLALGLSQSDLAKAVGVTANTVARWERGEQRIGNLKRLNAVLARLERTARKQKDSHGRGARSRQHLTSLPVVARRRHNLPEQLTSFVGREQEVHELHRLLGTTRLLTLTGPGGVGKTRLALQVASQLVKEYPDDGVWLVQLGPIGDPALVLHAVAAVLGVADEVGRPLVQSLQHALMHRRALLVLDNCEHLLPACAELADTALRSSPETRIIVTSREPLRIQGETVWRVPSLSLPDEIRGTTAAQMEKSAAVQLFVQRARAAQPSFALTEHNAEALKEICRRLDGIPLAIELAAACAEFLSPQDMLARLEDRFALLTRGSRTAPARQQSLRAAIEWSCDLLTETERHLFARLSVFSGSLTLDAAEAVCAGEGIRSEQVLDLLGELVSKSLVVAEPGPGGSRSYRLLETLRGFGRERLQTSAEAETFKRRHADFYVKLATRSLDEGAPASWAERLTRQHDNLDAALRWLIANREVEGAQLIGAALSNVWRQRGHAGEGRVIMSRLLALPGGTKLTRGRASLLAAAGLLAVHQGDFVAARDLLDECLTVLQPLGDRRELAQAHTWLVYVEMAGGNFEAARGHIEAGLIVARRLGDAVQEAILLVHLGQLLVDQGNDAAADTVLQQVLPTLRAHRATRMIARSLQLLGETCAHRGDHSESRRLLEESLATWNAISGRHGAARAQLDLAHLALDEGNHQLAAGQFAEGVRLCRDLGDRWGLALGFEGFASLAARSGRAERALQLAGAAAAMREAADVVPSLRQAARLGQDLARARQALSSARYGSAWQDGRAMPAERAIQVALGLSHGDTRGGLTIREREVVGLVARGWTDRQIADALVIDRRTAEGHVSRILGKLGLTSRAQLAVWATHNDLGVPRPSDAVSVAEPAFT